MRSIKSKTSRPLRVVCPLRIFRAVMWISAPVLFCAQSQAQLADSLQLEPEPEERFEVNWGADDSTKVNAVTSEVELSGNAFVAMDDIRLEAYRIIYSPQKNQACAFGIRDSLGDWIGRPVMTQGGQTFEQDELCFDLESRRGLSRQAVTVQGEAVFHAEVAKRQSDQRIHVANAKFTTCNADNPHFHFHLKRAIMIPGKKVVSGPFYLKFRKIPTPLALPFGWFPTPPEKRSQGLLMPGYGNGGALGFFLKDLGYYMPIGEYADTRLTGDIYTGGSWALRSSTNYRIRYRASGNLNLSYQRIRNGFTGLPTLSLSNQFFVRWSHSQDNRARPNSRFNTSVNFGSNNHFQSNITSNQQDYLTNTFQSSIQYSRSFPGKPISLALSARHAQNSQTGNVNLTAPSMTLNLQRSSLSKLLGLTSSRSKLLDEIAVSASSRFEQTMEAPDSVFMAGDWSNISFRNGIKHNASASTQMRLGFVSITPSFQYNEFWAFQELNGALVEDETGAIQQVTDTLSGFQTTRDWRLSANASTRFYGTFEFNPKRRVQAIRHVLSPTMGLSYTPELQRTQTVSLNDESYEFNPYSLNRFVPQDIRASGAVNFGLSQNIEAKVMDWETGELRKVRLIDNLVTSANYNFIADSLGLSDIVTRANTDLFNKVRVNLGIAHSAYARDSSGQRIDQFLVNQGEPILRMTRANAALGSSFNGGTDGAYPWNFRADYNLDLRKNWRPDLQRDTLIMTQSARLRGGIEVLDFCRVDVNTGYDLVRKEWTPTQLDVYWDLHCWELSVNWVPIGVRKSIYLRLNIKASMLKDLKVEYRNNNTDLLF